MSIVYTVLALCALGHIGAKAEQHVFFEEVEIEVIDPEYFDTENTNSFATDDGTVSTNWKIVKKFPPETKAHLEIWGYSMGEYTDPTVSKMMWEFCETFENGLARGYFNSMGITSDSCPPEPDNYSCGSWEPKQEDLPDNIRENKYVALVELIFNEEFLYKGKIFLEVQTF